MRIPCPFCGARESGEFTYLGDASVRRPAPAPDGGAAAEGAVFEYVYLRDNIAGPMREYWYHGGGCRSWLVVERDTRTHAIHSVEAAPGAGAAAPAGARR